MRKLNWAVLLVAMLAGVGAVAETPAPEPIKPPPIIAPPPVVSPLDTHDKSLPATPIGTALDAAKTPADTTQTAAHAQIVKALYTRLGGVAKIAAIAENLVDRLYADEKLQANAQVHRGLAGVAKPALRFYVTELMCQVCRGPQVYSGDPVHEIYIELKLTDDEFKALQGDLEQSLDHASVTGEDKKDTLGALTEVRSYLASVVLRVFHEKGVFTVMPGGWERLKIDDPNTLVAMQGPAPLNSGGPRPSVRILMEEFKAGLDMSAKEYLKANQLQMSKSLPNMKVVQSQSMMLNNEPIEALAATFTNGDKEVSSESFFYIKNKHAYTIQFMAAKDTFEQYRVVFSDVLRTLKVE